MIDEYREEENNVGIEFQKSDKEKAEEYAMREDVDTMKYSECYGERVFFEKEIKQAYLDGLTEGRKEQWHDLRKNPDDLPKEDCTEVIFVTENKSEILTGIYKNGGGEGTPIFDTFGIAFYDVKQVIAWCELPRFEE